MRLGRGGLAVAVAGLLLWAPAAGAVFPGEDGKLVVSKGSGGELDLYTYNADGTGEALLLGGAGNPSRPAVSADGQSVAFSDGGDLWRMPLAGGSAMQLTSGSPVDLAPVWPPDGRIWLLRDDQAWSMMPDGSDQRHELTDAAEELALAAAAPASMGGCTGTDPLLAFVRHDGQDLTAHVRRCDGSEMPVGAAGNLAFAPNGDLLVSGDDLTVCTAASAYASCAQPYTSACSFGRCLEGRFSAGGGLLYGVRTADGTDTLRSCDADPPSGCSFGPAFASGDFITYDAACSPCNAAPPPGNDPPPPGNGSPPTVDAGGGDSATPTAPLGPAPDLQTTLEMHLIGTFESRLQLASFQLLVGNKVGPFPTVANRGNAPAENVVLTVDLPAGFQITNRFVGRCTRAGRTARCELGTINSGQGFGFSLVDLTAERLGPFQVVVRASTTTPERDRLANVATFDGSVEKLENIIADPIPQRVLDGKGGALNGVLIPDDLRRDRASRAAQRRPGVERVEIAIVRLEGRARAVQRGRRPRTRCSWLASPRARFRQTRPTRNRCTRPVWLRAQLSRPDRRGRVRWSYRLRRGLPDGSYVLYARATTNSGAQQTQFSARLGNRRAFRVRR